MGDYGPPAPSYSTTSTASGGGWEGWFQNIAGTYMNARLNMRAMENIQRGETAYYREGQAAAAATGGIPPAVLLLGVGVLLVFAMKD